MLKTVRRPTKSALWYTCFISAGVFQLAVRTTEYQDSRLALESGCLSQKRSNAPRLIMRMPLRGSHNENQKSRVETSGAACYRHPRAMKMSARTGSKGATRTRTGHVRNAPCREGPGPSVCRHTVRSPRFALSANNLPRATTFLIGSFAIRISRNPLSNNQLQISNRQSIGGLSFLQSSPIRRFPNPESSAWVQSRRIRP
jgi:hypothetical protein